MKKNIKRSLGLLLCCLMLFTVAACSQSGGGDSSPSESLVPSETSSSGESSNPASAKNDLNIALTTDSGSLDPNYNSGYDFLYVLRTLYEPLWDTLDGNEFRYVLAKSVEMIDETTYTINLRDDVYFASGNKFTAEDVMFTIRKHNDRVGLSPHYRYIDLDKSIVHDDYTIELILTEPSLSTMLNLEDCYIYDSKLYDEENVSMTPYGSGPYELVSYVANSFVNVRLRDDYWGDTSGLIPNLNFKVLTEDSQRVNAIQTGEVDVARIPFQDVTFLQGINGVTVDLVPGTYTATLHMNPTTTRNVFSELGVDARSAIAHAIDRQAIVDIAYEGFASVARGPISINTPDAYPELFGKGIYGEPDNGYNPELARELAISSGLVDYTPVLINNGSALFKLIAEMVQADLSDIGVNCEVITLDSGSWLTYAFDESTWDMAVDFTDGITAANAYRVWSQMLGGYMTSPWPGSDRYVEILSTITQKYGAELDALYMELTDIHTSSLPWFTLVDTVTPTAYNSDLKGWKPTPKAYIIFTDLSW